MKRIKFISNYIKALKTNVRGFGVYLWGIAVIVLIAIVFSFCYSWGLKLTAFTNAQGLLDDVSSAAVFYAYDSSDTRLGKLKVNETVMKEYANKRLTEYLADSQFIYEDGDVTVIAHDETLDGHPYAEITAKLKYPVGGVMDKITTAIMRYTDYFNDNADCTIEIVGLTDDGFTELIVRSVSRMGEYTDKNL